MKIKEMSNLQLKKVQTDESGNFKYLGNAFTPPFSYYIEFIEKDFFEKKEKKKENKKEYKKEKDDLIKVFVILIELAGKIKEFRPKISIRNGKYYVNITGIKELTKVREMQYNNYPQRKRKR